MQSVSTINQRRSRRGRLEAYLAAGVTAAGLSTAADAGIVTIDVSGISGPNAGVASGQNQYIYNFPIAGPTLEIYNNSFDMSGLDGDDFLQFANGGVYASPVNFSAGTEISIASMWSGIGNNTVFRNGLASAPVFGANSYMGFRFSTDSGANYNYGWIEVTWNGTDTFEILSAAYEDTLNTPILAGDTGAAPVPEPASGAVVALLMGGTALRQWRKKRRDAETADSESLAS